MLVKNIEEVRVVANVSAASEYEKLSSHLANAEMSFIIPMLGMDMYTALLNYHKNPDSFKIEVDTADIDLAIINLGSGDLGSGEMPSAEDKAWAILLYYTQKTIVYLALWKGFDMLNAYISDGGFKRTETESTKSLFKYQEDNLKHYLVETGFNGLDQILEILETNIVYFEPYKSQLYKHKGRIIPDTKTFSEHYFINNSRIIFDRLRQHMKTAEELHVSKIVGAENMAFILAEIQKAEPAEKVKAILPYLRDPIAFLSTAFLMQESGAELTERGLYLKGVKSINNSDLLINSDEARVKALIDRNLNTAKDYMDRLKNYMLKNSSLWSDYDFPRGNVLHNRDNTGKKTFFA